MSGHIRRRGKTWYYKHEGGRDPVTGRRRQVERGGFATKRLASKAMHDSIARYQRGEHVDREKITVAQYLDEWLPGHLASVRPTTAVRDQSVVKIHIKPQIGHLRLQAVKAADLEDLYSRLRLDGPDRRPLSPGSIRTVHAILSKAFSDAERHGRIIRNPARFARPPRVDRSPDRFTWWTAEEARAFLKSVAQDDRRLLWMFALYTGMRRGEMLGLKWSEVDLERQAVRVVRQLIAPTHEGSFAPVKTAAGRRLVPLGPYLADAMASHRQRQREGQLSAGAAWQDNDLVFCDQLGRPLLPRTVSAWFKKDVAASGLRPITLHDLRHTHASLLMQAGISPKVVQERLGHSDIRMTLDTYSHAMPGMQEQAAEAVTRLLEAG